MAIRAIVFDIGGVLEITPKTGWEKNWEAKLNLKPDELNEKLRHLWRGGSLGHISEEEVESGIGQILGLDRAQVDAFMRDLWEEYLGTLNTELLDYFASLRPRYRTGILSNSFVGARREEQGRYRFGDLCDVVIYSHEEGMRKPEKRFYELACQRLGVHPEEMIFLDDWEEAIIPARELGIYGIQFKNNAQAIADIEVCLGQFR